MMAVEVIFASGKTHIFIVSKTITLVDFAAIAKAIDGTKIRRFKIHHRRSVA
jgi:hypothetical protein